MLHHVQLASPPGSEDRSRAFYVGVIGLTEVPKPPALAGRGGCWFAGPGIEVHLGIEADFRPARKAHPGIVVADLDALAGRLADAGQQVTVADGEVPGHQRFHCHDPHGNRLEFLQRLPESWPLPDGSVVRRAAASDVPAIVALLRDDDLGVRREDGTDEAYRSAFAAIDRDPTQLLAVVESGGAVVGTCQLTFTAGLSRGGATRMTVEAVRVASTARNGGLGTAMLGWALDRARERGATLVQLTSDLTRTAAIDWYTRLGFRHSHAGLKLSLDD